MSESSGGNGQSSNPYGGYSGYEVYDESQEKIGKVDDLFVDVYDRPEYMGVKMGLIGTKTTLVPIEIVEVNDEENRVQVSADKDKIKDGPTFDDDQEIDLDYEARVREHYGLGESPDASERGHFGEYYSDDDDSGDSDRSGRSGVDTEYGERSEKTSDREETDSGERSGFVAGGGSSMATGSDERGGSSDRGDSDDEGGALRIHKRVKVERPDASGDTTEEVVEEEVIVEEDENESGRSI